MSGEEPQVRANNATVVHVAFKGGYQGEAALVELEGRWKLAYRSSFTPPLGHRMTIGDRLLRVVHVEPATKPGLPSTLTLVEVGQQPSA